MKHLTQKPKTLNLTTSQKRDNGFDSPYDIGVSAPFGIALFLCQKSIIMMGVNWETSVYRFLCHGLSTRLTSIAQCLIAFRVGLSNLTKGKDYAPHIQHSSSPRSATPQNPNPFNASPLYALKGCLPFAPCTSHRMGGVA